MAAPETLEKHEGVDCKQDNDFKHTESFISQLYTCP